jgi:hypothetical protein
MSGPTVVYILCMLASMTCAGLLTRAWLASRSRLLLWTAISFGFLALNNLLLVADLVIFITQVNLLPYRQATPAWPSPRCCTASSGRWTNELPDHAGGGPDRRRPGHGLPDRRPVLPEVLARDRATACSWPSRPPSACWPWQRPAGAAGHAARGAQRHLPVPPGRLRADHRGGAGQEPAAGRAD